MKLRLVACLAALFLIFDYARAEAGPEGLAAALQRRYKLATIRMGPHGDPVLEPGTVLEVRMEGIVSFAEPDASYAELCPSEVRRGAMHTPRSLACTSLAPKSRRLLRRSERVCVTAINVSQPVDTVSFYLATSDTADGCGASSDRRALIVFQLPKGSPASISVERVEQAVGRVLAEPESVPQGTEGATRAGGPAEGQTLAEVRAMLGPPALVADLGAKIIYFYPTVKIFFKNGRVSSVRQLSPA